jgi:hypothetical protein
LHCEDIEDLGDSVLDEENIQAESVERRGRKIPNRTHHFKLLLLISQVSSSRSSLENLLDSFESLLDPLDILEPKEAGSSGKQT